MFYLLFYSSGLYLTFFYYIILEKKYIFLQAERKKKHIKKQKGLKNVGGKADSLAAPLFILMMFLCCFVTKL